MIKRTIYFIFILLPDSVYYWRIDEVNENGITTGETWRFDMEKTETAVYPVKANSISIFPNSVSERFFVEGVKAGSTVYLYDLHGRLFYSVITNNDKLNIDTRNWQQGIYIIRANSTEGVSYVKLIKE